MRIDLRNLLMKRDSQRRNENLMSALELIERREKAHLKITIPCEAVNELDQFLEGKGFLKSEGISILIQYGLSDENEEELEKLRLEKESQMARLNRVYCTMKFKAYLYFMENKAMTMRLRSLLSENRSLKTRLKNEGLQNLIPEDEWDHWDEAVITGYYRKYVFTNRL